MNTIALVNKAKKGNEEAFTKLIEAKKENIYKIAFSYVKNKEDALDIVSEAIYKSFVSIGSLKNPEYFYTWLTKIVINVAITTSKKKDREIYFEDNLSYEDIEQNTNIEENLDLYSAIDDLTEPYKTVIILKYFEDMTITQVAEVLDKPSGTIKTYLNKALKKLRENFKEV